MRPMTPRTLRRALLVTLLAALAGCGSSNDGGGGWKPGQPLTLDVTGVFPAGTALRDASSGAKATVSAQGSVTITPDSSGVLLLERDSSTPVPTDWRKGIVYFLMTDRFFDSDPSNDGSYGRTKDGAGEIGTWHGGDWKGVVAKLDHIASLGTSAIWISPIVEQVHGWVGGGSGDFKHYGYAGYWALDFTRLDANWGNEADLQALVDAAHARGIRVLADVVLNHPGYATGDDLVKYLPEVFFDGTGNAFKSFQPAPLPPNGRGYLAWNDLVDYNSDNWVNWWTPSWIRAGFPGFPSPGTTDTTRQLTFLPDFLTESPAAAGKPPLFDRKTDTHWTDIPNGTVRQYLVRWHTDWLRQFGFDGFRCDTAKNVELESWRALKDAAIPALAAWKAANPTKKLDDAPFWMVGEVFGHAVQKDDYYTLGGFDSLLNFEFQPQMLSALGNRGSLLAWATELDLLYSSYAGAIASDPSFNVLSYVSSHDTQLFFDSIGNNPALQRQAGTALFLAPGQAQIFYGDETGRKLSNSGTDPTQGTRSDMNWSSIDTSILSHWQKLGTFRARHPSVGSGQHRKLSAPSEVYAFARTWSSAGTDDSVVVVLTPTP